jgi:hypothetical protein
MDPAELVDCVPDERLLGEDLANLPAAVGRPEPLPRASPARKRIVAVGATLTGVTLIGGIGLAIAGLIAVVVSGLGVLALVALVLGLALASTHWGWVHVAEATADGIEHRRAGEAVDRQRQWLATIKPYPHYEVITSVEPDGAIAIARIRYEPVRCGERRFTFKRSIEQQEVHSGDEPGAAVVERAELLRRQAASDTHRERERFEVVADVYETALLSADDQQQRQAARRAASQALSEQINANLREPPLIE